MDVCREVAEYLGALRKGFQWGAGGISRGMGA